jgi:sterol desaturase/sphingolipid hydroxylase (fatty acid hydroxylase superfamily)
MSETRSPRRSVSHLSLETTEPMTFGYGFISGLLSALLGISALGIVLSARFPQVFMLEDLQPLLYSSPFLRPATHLMLVASFLFGTISSFLRANKTLAVTGLACTLVAALFGGSQAAAVYDGPNRPALAIDFFVLNLLLYSAVLVPLERLFGLRPEQKVFRRHWVVDLSYFFVNSLLIEVLTVFTLQPALILFDWARVDSLSRAIGSMALALQLPLIVLVADFTQYWVHRTFHTVPFLWPFHAIHHSAEEMDWLAGSRLHLVDVILTRAVVYVPIFVLGFSEIALLAYVFLVAAQATFIHANVRWRFRPMQRLIATPAFHHWHHAAEREAADKNFAVHTPVWDVLFGTYYLPDRWPSGYGLIGGVPVPGGWWRQLFYPLSRRRRADLP